MKGFLLKLHGQLISPNVINQVAPLKSEDFVVGPTVHTLRFIMKQTMLRVRDPKLSLKWYSEVLGMRLLQELHFEEYKFSLYFMGYCQSEDIPKVGCPASPFPTVSIYYVMQLVNGLIQQYCLSA